ncbi:MAG: helicase-related protein [Candidatus Eisenbacteria bacterium]
MQEILYFDRESPHRKYGAGLLHPVAQSGAAPADQAALHATDTVGVDDTDEDSAADASPTGDPDGAASGAASGADGVDFTEDFEVGSSDTRHPSTIGVSVSVGLADDGEVIVALPRSRQFDWQESEAQPCPLNGRYERCTREWTNEVGARHEAPVWRRVPALPQGAELSFSRSELQAGHVLRRDVVMPAGSPIALRVEVFPRPVRGRGNTWLLTVVVRNVSTTGATHDPHEAILYQTYFEVGVRQGRLEPYPESQRAFDQLDAEEQSLALMYREAATWGIGHGCAAGWDAGPSQSPATVYADIMPAVQLPSMTPDIEVNGMPVSFPMRELAALPSDGTGEGWRALENLASGYEAWIQIRRGEARGLSPHLAGVAERHLDACMACLDRIRAGIALLRCDVRVHTSFRFANLAMLLQQIATKQLARRPLQWDAATRRAVPAGMHTSPWGIYQERREDEQRLGSWRAFQIAFLLMSLEGVVNGASEDREIVDLVWFPTGGGKTEAYLAVMAFYMFHERLSIPEDDATAPKRDGTNVLMRYTLRMLTTQQFQRAASLICAMEHLRRHPTQHSMGVILGKRFSLGLWIGGEGSPNKLEEAKRQLALFRKGESEGNPLILTECPWCRAEIGRHVGKRTGGARIVAQLYGIAEVGNEGALLLCPDVACEFGQEQRDRWLPVEVIDERIYRHPPSLVIATADKLAMVAYRPAAGALFGRRVNGGTVCQVAVPPGLIIQDELHLISGPLGTMYALYEAVFEQLCSHSPNGVRLRPKLIASTATIRGAAGQVMALYARHRIQLFPSPGLAMGDSFFGTYARDEGGGLRDGRLYLGIHANDYGSVLTAQVRTFSSALFRPWFLAPEDRDPWWTLLGFYNSIRELGGAKTLFDSDIRSRLKFMFNRENFAHDKRRNLRIVEELTSRLSQAEIVSMMDRLSAPYSPIDGGQTLDVCLASSIIEVGVDIDRLSLMGVVGQPKTTATYIQVTGRVGRRWWERPGLILTIYNPSKSRDRSHFEQFHSYHRRLYERVEPTTATPFALSAIGRGAAGALLTWVRQHSDAKVGDPAVYAAALELGHRLLRDRCLAVQTAEDQARSLDALERAYTELKSKWQQNPQEWEKFPQKVDGEYLMLWPGQFATALQKRRGVLVPSSMRQVDRNAELEITQGYI